MMTLWWRLVALPRIRDFERPGHPASLFHAASPPLRFAFFGFEKTCPR